MKILITGATGMMGRATALAMLARGDRVSTLQRRTARLAGPEFLGDITDAPLLRRATAGQDAVLHLAAKVDVFGRWADYLRVNVAGTQAVIDACRAAGVGRLVAASSPSVAHAGHALVGVGAGPADPATARSHYARSKALAELLALAADGPDLAVLSIRPHLVWGPGDTQLIGPVVDRARAGRLPLIGSGAALIDTTYVDNAVSALIAALDVPAHGESLVVSNGEPRPVGELLRRICDAMEVPGPRGRVPLPVARLAGSAVEGIWRGLRRADLPPMTRFLAEQLGTAHWFDQRRTREVLGWRPAVSLEEGFQRLARDNQRSRSARTET